MKNVQLAAKKREILTKEECSFILRGEYTPFIHSEKPLLREFYIHHRMNLLKLAAVVDYERKAYVAEVGNVRITFDKNFKTTLHSTEIFSNELGLLKANDEDIVILEVKYDDCLPEYIQYVLQTPNRTRQSLSKYAMCRKYMKTNRWEDN